MAWQRRALVLCGSIVLVAACSRSGVRHDGAPGDAGVTAVGPAGSTADAALAWVPPDASDDPPVLTPEARRAYAKAMGEARRAQRAGKLDEAVAGFGRALTVLPEDPRALAERGYARYQAGHYALAKQDLDRAGAFAPAADPKLAAAIELNLGLVSEAMAGDAGSRAPNAEAAAHFRRSNEIAPSAAAQRRMDTCPVTVKAAETTIYPSLDALRAAVVVDGGEPLEPHQSTGSTETYYTQRIGSAGDPGNGTLVAVSLPEGVYATVRTGPTDVGRCGPIAEDVLVHEGDGFTLTYQERAPWGSDTWCSCTDEDTACTRPWRPGADDPHCECKNLVCPMGCSGSDGVDGKGNAGTHEEIVVDGTGHGILAWSTDTAFLDRVTVTLSDTLPAFHVRGLNCHVDGALPYRPDARAR